MELTQYDPATLRAIAGDAVLMEIGRKAIEDELIDMRDRRIWIGMRHNGFVIKEADHRSSDVIRFGPEVGVQIALRAIADATPGQLDGLRRQLEAPVIVDETAALAYEEAPRKPALADAIAAFDDETSGHEMLQPDEVTDERIYDDLQQYARFGIIDYILPSEPLGEVWTVGWSGQMLKFETKEGIVGFLTGIGVCAHFVHQLNGGPR